jgi:4-hydroxy-3-methylbut-2-en-1-yl diphosphate reductase
MGLADQSPKKTLRILLAQPRGFCAGVERAIEIVERALAIHGAPVYVRHEIVHNKRVVENLKAKGARFVEEVDEIPEGAVTVFSAHGVSEAVERAAKARGLYTVDATCPLVSKVHVEGRRYAERGYEVVLIGHAGHPEVVGTMGRIPGTVHLIGSLAEAERFQPGDPGKLAYVTQTTLSLDDTRDIIAALKTRFPDIVGPDTRDICYATQNRQIAVRSLARSVDAILVVGAKNSSNSNRLREIGESSGVPSYLIEDAEELDPAWLEGASTVGISAGASAPEELVEELLDRLSSLFATQVETLFGVEERVQFRLPDEVSHGVGEATFQEVSP